MSADKSIRQSHSSPYLRDVNLLSNLPFQQTNNLVFNCPYLGGTRNMASGSGQRNDSEELQEEGLSNIALVQI